MAPDWSLYERVGRIVALMGASAIHRKYSIEDLERLVLPCLLMDQAWVVPKACAIWAWLTEEAERSYLERSRKLRPEDFAAGDRLWIVEFIAPFGDVRNHVRDLQALFYRRYGVVKARTCRTYGTGKVQKTGWFTNAHLDR